MKVSGTYFMSAFSLILLVTLLTVNCNDDKNPVCPDPCGGDTTCPAQVIPEPDIQNIWPNEDGTSWHYDIVQRDWGIPGTVYWPTEEDVPDLPSVSDLALLIDTHQAGSNPDTVDGIYKLAFDGMMTTSSGAYGQKVVRTLYSEDSGGYGGYTAGSEISGKASFLRNLLVARPDLKDRIMPVLKEMEDLAPSLSETGSSAVAWPIYWPTFLNGYCWVKTDDYIGGYGDLDQLLAWKFLDSDLSVGHEFVHQCVPELADDVFLHCLVLRHFELETGMGVKGAIECLYMVDFGIHEAWDPYMNPMGYTRFFEYGTITYAAEIGPVSSYERKMIQNSSSISAGSSDVTITLIGTNAGD